MELDLPTIISSSSAEMCKPAHSKVNKEAMGADVSRIPVAVAPRAWSPHRGTALRVEDAVELTSIPDRQLHHNRIHIALRNVTKSQS